MQQSESEIENLQAKIKKNKELIQSTSDSLVERQKEMDQLRQCWDVANQAVSFFGSNLPIQLGQLTEQMSRSSSIRAEMEELSDKLKVLMKEQDELYKKLDQLEQLEISTKPYQK